MLKKIGIYSIFLIAGLVLGYVFFMPGTEGSKVDAIEGTAKHEGIWTCSMHPEIKGKENGTCPLCKMDLVYMDTQTNTDDSSTQFQMTKEAVELANIETSTVSFGNTGDNGLVVSGIIVTNKDTDAVQTTLFDGRIEAFYMSSVGKRVRKNQEIGMIYSPDLYLAQDKLLSSVSYREKNMKLYEAARNTLGLWKMTDEQIDELIKSKTPQQNFPLYADVNGTVTEVFAREGNYYKQGDLLFKTSDLRTVWAEFDIYESQLNSFKVGQEISIAAATLTQPIKAKISFIEPLLNSVKRTATVRVVIPNRNDLLKPGMIVQGQLNTATSGNNIISVPKSAVLWTGKRSLVYREIAKNKAIFEPTEVVLGQSIGEYYEVLNGLSLGDHIVTEGTFTVDAAAQLNGTKSMMSNTMDGGDVKHHGKGSATEMKEGTTPLEIDRIPESTFNEQVQRYMSLKDAFVSSDIQKIKRQSKLFQEVMIGSKTKTDSDAMARETGELVERLEGIITANSLVEQRLDFKYLSEIMVRQVSLRRANTTALYVQHCDCADNKKGATWISYQEQIRNPFFGDEMLTCGRVERILQ